MTLLNVRHLKPTTLKSKLWKIADYTAGSQITLDTTYLASNKFYHTFKTDLYLYFFFLKKRNTGCLFPAVKHTNLNVFLNIAKPIDADIKLRCKEDNVKI